MMPLRRRTRSVRRVDAVLFSGMHVVPRLIHFPTCLPSLVTRLVIKKVHLPLNMGRAGP
jgi:hypothetical protein